jgi:integrase/recombinase XerC
MDILKSIEQFEEWGMISYTPRTLDIYTGQLRKFGEFIGNKDIQGIDLSDVNHYWSHLKNRGYASSSIAYALIAIRILWKFLNQRRLVNLDYQLIKIPKYTSRSFVWIDDEEVQKMFDKIGDKTFSNLRDKLIIKFLYASGVRVSELCALKITDLNLKEQQAVIISKKNLKRRIILWDDETTELLKEYLELREKIALDDYLIVGSRNAARLTTRQVQRIIKDCREVAGIEKKITPHSFRHALGLRAVNSNMNVRYIQVLLGHKNLESSKIYLDYKDENLRREYRKVFCKKEKSKMWITFSNRAKNPLFTGFFRHTKNP